MGDLGPALLAVRQGVPPGADAAEARDAARDILSRPEYAEPEPSVVERAGEWVFDRVGSFFGTLTGGGPGAVVGWVVVALLVAGAALLLVRALRVPGPREPTAGPRLRYGTETPRDAGAWSAESARLEAAGDRRGALRCRYQALLATVVSTRLVDDVPGRTARGYELLLAERLPGAAGDLAELTTAFEAAWYGGAPVGAAELARFRELSEAVEHRALRDVVAV